MTKDMTKEMRMVISPAIKLGDCLELLLQIHILSHSYRGHM